MHATCPSLVGKTLDRWTLQRRIDSAAMHEQYEAIGPDGEQAMVGVLPQHLAERAPYRNRFLRECRQACGIASANVVHHLGCGVGYNRLWYATERIAASQTLAQRLASGWRPSGDQLIALSVQAWRGLAAINLAGLTHRALHPAELHLDELGVLRIGGLGLAPDPSGDEAVLVAVDTLQPPECLAPEQIRCAPYDARGDLYAMACVLYWVASGRPPFHGETRADIVVQHQEAAPIPLRRFTAEVPAELSVLFDGLLAKDPSSRRPQSVLEALQLCEALHLGGGMQQSTRRLLRTAPASAVRPAAAPAAAPPVAPPAANPAAVAQAPAPRPRRLGKRMAAMIVLGVLVLAAASMTIILRSSDGGASTKDSLPIESVQPSVPMPAVSTAAAPIVTRDITPSSPALPAAAQRADAVAVHELVARSGHLGPVADLRMALGEPDVIEDGGRELWYADYRFIVEKDFVISASRR